MTTIDLQNNGGALKIVCELRNSFARASALTPLELIAEFKTFPKTGQTSPTRTLCDNTHLIVEIVEMSPLNSADLYNTQRRGI